MEIIGIMLKSGKFIDLENSGKSDVIIRESEGVNYRGMKTTEGISWLAEPYKTTEVYLRFIGEEEIWEFKESEVAAIKYRKYKEQEQEDYSQEIKIV